MDLTGWRSRDLNHFAYVLCRDITAYLFVCLYHSRIQAHGAEKKSCSHCPRRYFCYRYKTRELLYFSHKNSAQATSYIHCLNLKAVLFCGRLFESLWLCFMSSSSLFICLFELYTYISLTPFSLSHVLAHVVIIAMVTRHANCYIPITKNSAQAISYTHCLNLKAVLFCGRLFESL